MIRNRWFFPQWDSLLWFLFLCHLLDLLRTLQRRGFRAGLRRCECCWQDHLLVSVALERLGFSTCLPPASGTSSEEGALFKAAADLLSWGDAADVLAPRCPFIMEQMRWLWAWDYSPHLFCSGKVRKSCSKCCVVFKQFRCSASRWTHSREEAFISTAPLSPRHNIRFLSAH